MRLGLGVLPNKPIKEIVKIAETAEEKHFDYVIMPEIIPSERDAFTTLTALASRTKRIKLNLETDPLIRHPVLTTIAALTLHEFSDNRAMISLRSGVPATLEALAIPKNKLKKGAKAIKEAVKLMGLLFSGRKVDFDGETLKALGVSLFQKPTQRLPIYIQSSNEAEMLRLSGEIGDGVILPCPLEYFNYAVEMVMDGAATVGRDISTFDFALSLAWYVAEEASVQELSLLKWEVAFRIAISPSDLFEAIGLKLKPVKELKKAFLHEPERVPRYVTDEMVEAFSFRGSMRDCRKKVERFYRAIRPEIRDRVQIIVGEPYGPNKMQALRTIGDELFQNKE